MDSSTKEIILVVLGFLKEIAVLVILPYLAMKLKHVENNVDRVEKATNGNAAKLLKETRKNSRAQGMRDEQRAARARRVSSPEDE